MVGGLAGKTRQYVDSCCLCVIFLNLLALKESSSIIKEMHYFCRSILRSGAQKYCVGPRVEPIATRFQGLGEGVGWLQLVGCNIHE
jgi:hypothetical protein